MKVEKYRWFTNTTEKKENLLENFSEDTNCLLGDLLSMQNS